MNEKIIKEFYEYENEDGSKTYKIEVMACALEENEHNKIKTFIEQHGGTFTNIDADSIFARFEYKDYEKAIKMLKKLEQEGWKW